MKLLVCLLSILVATMAEDALKVIREGNSKFTTKMFNAVVNESPDTSVVLSPFSVLTPLGQLALASVGESHDELLNVVGLPNDDVVKKVFPLVYKELESIKGVDLKMASKIYIPINKDINDDFQVISRDVFGSEVLKVNFSKNIETAKDINSWVEDQTNHRIKDLVKPESLSSGTLGLLVNAIYFKGSWQKKFDKAETTNRDFYVSEDKTIKVPTMQKLDEYAYAENEDLNAKLLELPYYGREASFLVVLPNDVNDLPALEEKLNDPSVLENARHSMISYSVNVHLPKFKIETSTDLKQILRNMGIEKIFDVKKAKMEKLLKNMTSGFSVSSAIQKAFIEVNEDGAEAAAANEFDFAAAIPGQESVIMEFDANRPFYFALIAKNMTLFNGVYIGK